MPRRLNSLRSDNAAWNGIKPAIKSSKKYRRFFPRNQNPPTAAAEPPGTHRNPELPPPPMPGTLHPTMLFLPADSEGKEDMRNGLAVPKIIYLFILIFQ